ncbi:hypothetical protein HYH02_006308 [Chlamydomonas schloesseri]|uniref:Uncharacterized protein n=1 Tax=Chlamydomonas schloesseri TaxID=2026947 RepID=A0A836B5P9_9CHLO|nr:hypothetical protein HYH02_006308 [Chlamydomonas schloesseri]|eukprot:KAG2448416.1 hypothetical protein HYH02_006308 [Chlamydomonas schloesseri]
MAARNSSNNASHVLPIPAYPPAQRRLLEAALNSTCGNSTRGNASSVDHCSTAAIRLLWNMLVTTAVSPAQLLLPPPSQAPQPQRQEAEPQPQEAAEGAAGAAAAAAGWKPYLNTVPELQDAVAAESVSRILAATAAFARRLQLVAAASPAAASLGNLGAADAFGAFTSARHLLSSEASAGTGAVSGVSAAKKAQGAVTLSGAAAEAFAAANSNTKATGATTASDGSGGDRTGAAARPQQQQQQQQRQGQQQQGQSQQHTNAGPQRVAQDVLEYAAVMQLELQAIQTARQDKTADGFQAFPLVRRSVLAALSSAALLLGAAEAAERSANGTTSSGWRQRAWSADVDAKVLLLLGELYSLHRDGAVRKQGVELFHVSKGGGTSFADLSALNGCLSPTRHDNCLMPRPWDDRPRWLNPTEARIRFQPIQNGKMSVIDWWSDSGPRNPYTFGNNASRAGYCRNRLATMSQRYIQFATNEYTLYGGQDSPRDTFMCPELLNTIVIREPRARLMSHLKYMLPMLVEVAGTDAAFRPGGGASNVAGWDAAAPFVFDNYLTRSLLGEAVFRSPVGALRDAARFWTDAAPAPATTTSTNTSATSASPSKEAGTEAEAWAKLASAARLLLQQFDVVMALEDGEANRPHFKRGLGWPYPVDLIHKRVGSEAKIQVDVDSLLPPDLDVMVQRHTLDAQLYGYGQLFSKLDLVVWDTAAQLEAQACPAGGGNGLGGLGGHAAGRKNLATINSLSATTTLTRRAARIERRRLHAASHSSSSDDDGSAGGGAAEVGGLPLGDELPAWFRRYVGSSASTVMAGQPGSPSDFPPLLTPPLRRLLAEGDDVLAELEDGGSSSSSSSSSRHVAGSSSSSSSSRKLLKVLATGVTITPGGVPHRYSTTHAHAHSNVLGNPNYLAIVNKVLLLEPWNVTRAVNQGLRQQQGLQGQQQGLPACNTVAAASWGSITGSCGWVGVKLWASSLHSRGQLLA